MRLLQLAFCTLFTLLFYALLHESYAQNYATFNREISLEFNTVAHFEVPKNRLWIIDHIDFSGIDSNGIFSIDNMKAEKLTFDKVRGRFAYKRVSINSKNAKGKLYIREYINTKEQYPLLYKP